MSVAILLFRESSWRSVPALESTVQLKNSRMSPSLLLAVPEGIGDRPTFFLKKFDGVEHDNLLSQVIA